MFLDLQTNFAANLGLVQVQQFFSAESDPESGDHKN